MISKTEERIRAWEYLDRELVLRNARYLDKKAILKNLAGIPVGIKDIFNTKDMPTQMGSPLWKYFTPGNDARVVHNIRMQDGIIFGKTVTAEFAVHYLAETKTVNPYNADHICGTSSSGSAVAVASYMVPLALGSQTGGSIIRPASYCGVFGFKPTFGVIPRTGMLKTSDTLDTVGCFARSIDDIKLLFNAIRVRGINYPFVNDKLKEFKIPKKGNKIKIGFILDGVDVFAGYEPYAREAFKSYINKLSNRKDIELIKINPPADFNMIHAIHSFIYDKALSYYFKEEFKAKSKVSKIMREIIDRGNSINSAKYNYALKKQAELRLKMEKRLSGYDVLLSLSTAGEPPVINETEKQDTCLIWTLLGRPTLNIPKFKGPNQLPFGLQVSAQRYEDYKMLAIAKHILI